MKTILAPALALSMMFASALHATISVPLTIQEALYPGDPTGTSTSSRVGIARTDDPITVGIPLTNDGNGINSISSLTISGASIGQFRVLSCWGGGTPTGTPATSCSGGTNIKWVLVDTQASLSAGAQNTSYTLASGGSGNFGGSNLATDNGTTITVSTNGGTCGSGSAICFTIKKASTNILDVVTVGATTLVSTGTSAGLILKGPTAGNSTCGTCTTTYSSANDSSSTASIEENGPAKAVIKITGTMKELGGGAYTTFTVRLYFYKGKSYVKATHTITNGGYSSTANLTSAFKGMKSYELQVTPNISGTLNWKVAGDSIVCTSGVCSGTMSGSDNVYIYQGNSGLMTVGSLTPPVPYTTDSGYVIYKNAASQATGGLLNYPTGWADIANGSGVGMTIGHYQMAAYSPKSLEFDAGGADVRLGIFASENGNPTGGPGNGTHPYYQAWQERKMHDMWMNFHTSAPASPGNDFLKFELPLVGHANYTWYNTTAALSTGSTWPLINPSTEDSFFTTFSPKKPAFGASFTGRDLGTDGNGNFPLYVYRYYTWEGGGGGNQVEFHWSRLLNFIRRNWSGGYLDALHFYRFVASTSFPFLVGDNWSSHTGEIDQRGYPNAFVPTNNSQVYTTTGRWDFSGQEHSHVYGIFDYYMLSGDENVKDAFGGMIDLYASSWSGLYGNKGGYINPRSSAIAIMTAARLHNYLLSVGDSTNAAAVQAQALNVYTKQLQPDLCVSGYPAGCTFTGASANAAGISRVRGMAAGTYQNITTAEGGVICANTSPYRIAGAFQQDILMGGLLEFRNEQGSGWAYYNEAFDLLYGLSQFELTEDYFDDGTGSWASQGNRYYLALDAANNVPVGCAANTGNNSFDYYNPPSTAAIETTWNRYYIQSLYNGSVSSWKNKFNVAAQRVLANGSIDDFDHFQFAQVIAATATAPAQSLVTAKINSVSFSSPNYTVNISVPIGATSYRLKCSTTNAKSLVEWIGFDPGTNTWIGDPAAQQNWFAATEVTGLPSPSGTSQAITVAASSCGGQTNLTSTNFMVKAWASLPTNTWVQVPTHGAPASAPGFEKLVFNPDLNKSLIFGTYHSSQSEGQNALLSYDYELNTWYLVGQAEYIGNEHFSGAGHPWYTWPIYDSNNQVYLGIGSESGSSSFQALFHEYSYDLGAQIGYDKQTTGAAAHPDRAIEASATFDATQGKMYLLSGGRGTQSYTNGTPGSPANAWTVLSPTFVVQGGGTFYTNFASIQASTTVYNTADSCSYMFGGWLGGSGFNNILFKYCASTNTWTQMSPSGTPPSARGWAAMSYDSLNNVIILFGGKDSAESDSNPGMTDMFVYNVAGNSWSTLSPSGTAPSMETRGAFDHMIYDPAHNIHIFANGPYSTPPSPSGNADAPSYNGPFPILTFLYRYAGTGPSPGVTVQSAVNPIATTVASGARTRNATGWSLGPMLNVGNGTLNMSRTESGTLFDTSDAAPPNPYVDNWNGSSWTQWPVSMSGSCPGNNWYQPTVAYAGGRWWLTFYGAQGNNKRFYVVQWNGSNAFSQSCTSPMAPQGAGISVTYGKIVDVGGVAYLVTLENQSNLPPTPSLVYVQSWNGLTWSVVGGGPLNANTALATSADIVSDGTHPCVAWADYSIVTTGTLSPEGPGQIRLSCLISGTWAVQGGGSWNVNTANVANDPSIVYQGGLPYIAFTERTATGNNQLYVRTLSSGTPTTIGNGLARNRNRNSGWAFRPSLATDGSSNLYLGWIEWQSPHTFQGSNNYTLAGSINSSVTTITLTNGTGGVDGTYFYLADTPSPEILYLVSGGGTSTWTVLRGQYGTTAQAHTAVSGAVVLLSEVVETRGRAYVQQYNGGVWTVLSAQPASLTGGTSINGDPLYGSAQQISLAYYGGKPVAAWSETNWGTSTQQLFAKEFTGGAWAAFGTTPPPCVITPSSIGTMTVGQIISVTFTATNCTTSTWSTTGTLPAGLSFNPGAGTITGTVSGSSATYNFGVSYSTATNSYSVLVNAAITVTTASPLAGGITGNFYTQTLAASGGTTPLSWTVSSGTVPTGLTLSSGGVLSGIPTVAAVYSFTARATDVNSVSGQKTFSVTIDSNVPAGPCSSISWGGMTNTQWLNLTNTQWTTMGSGGVCGPTSFSVSGVR